MQHSLRKTSKPLGWSQWRQYFIRLVYFFELYLSFLLRCIEQRNSMLSWAIISPQSQLHITTSLQDMIAGVSRAELLVLGLILRLLWHRSYPISWSRTRYRKFRALGVTAITSTSTVVTYSIYCTICPVSSSVMDPGVCPCIIGKVAGSSLTAVGGPLRARGSANFAREEFEMEWMNQSVDLCQYNPYVNTAALLFRGNK